MNKLKQEFMGLPLYAWLAGGAALLLSILYFSKHKGSGTTASTGTSPSAGNYPQNIYDSTNVYNQPGSAPGSASVAPPPVSPFGPGGMPNPPPIMSSLAVPGLPGVTLPGGNIHGLGGSSGMGGGSAALMPHPVNPNHWQPPMNSDIFGRGPGSGQVGVAPVIVWNMTPTQAYTQA